MKASTTKAATPTKPSTSTLAATTVISGTLSISVADPAAFVRDPAVRAVLKTGIADALGVLQLFVRILRIAAGRRLLAAEPRELQGGGVLVDYEVEVPDDEAASLAASVAGSETVLLRGIRDAMEEDGLSHEVIGVTVLRTESGGVQLSTSAPATTTTSALAWANASVTEAASEVVPPLDEDVDSAVVFVAGGVTVGVLLVIGAIFWYCWGGARLQRTPLNDFERDLHEVVPSGVDPWAEDEAERRKPRVEVAEKPKVLDDTMVACIQLSILCAEFQTLPQEQLLQLEHVLVAELAILLGLPLSDLCDLRGRPGRAAVFGRLEARCCVRSDSGVSLDAVALAFAEADASRRIELQLRVALEAFVVGHALGTIEVRIAVMAPDDGLDAVAHREEQLAVVSMRLSGIDFAKLGGSERQKFAEASLVAIEELSGLPRSRIRDQHGKLNSVTLRGGSVIVDCKMDLPSGYSVAALESGLGGKAAAELMVAVVDTVPGVRAAVYGPITYVASVAQDVPIDDSNVRDQCVVQVVPDGGQNALVASPDHSPEALSIVSMDSEVDPDILEAILLPFCYPDAASNMDQLTEQGEETTSTFLSTTGSLADGSLRHQPQNSGYPPQCNGFASRSSPQVAPQLTWNAQTGVAKIPNRIVQPNSVDLPVWRARTGKAQLPAFNLSMGTPQLLSRKPDNEMKPVAAAQMLSFKLRMGPPRVTPHEPQVCAVSMLGCEIDSEQTLASKPQVSPSPSSPQQTSIGFGQVSGWHVGAMKMSGASSQTSNTPVPKSLQDPLEPTRPAQHCRNEEMQTAWVAPASTSRKRKVVPAASEEGVVAQQEAGKAIHAVKAYDTEHPPAQRSAFTRQDPHGEGLIWKQDLVDVIAALDPNCELEDISSLVDVVGRGNNMVDYEEFFEFLYADDAG